MRTECVRRWFRPAFVAVLVVGVPSSALAQAWVPPKGEMTFATFYQYQRAQWHTDTTGERVDLGLMEWHNAIADVGYSFSDRFAVRLAIPYVFGKYTGKSPHMLNGSIVPSDDGSVHSTFQDLRFEARFMATTGSFVVTPFIGGGLPSSDYATLGHAAPGKGTWDVGAGVNIGRRLDPILPQGYFQGRYAFTIPEKVNHVWHNRSSWALEFGHFVRPAFALRVFGGGVINHGGYRLFFDTRLPLNFLHHDQLIRERYVGLGVGASYSLNRAIDVSTSWFKQLAGSNGVLGSTLGVGVAWNVSPTRLIRQGKAPAPDPDRP